MEKKLIQIGIDIENSFYQTLKELTRKNTSINEDSINNFIESLKIDENIKSELRKITPTNYTGI